MADAAQSGADTINQQPPLVLARRCRWLLLAFGALLSVAMLDAAGPDRRTVEPWLGTFAAGAERIGLRWTEAGLHVELGNVTVPVDGAWHETVPTFAVRQRATWLTARGVLRVEEQHNFGALWQYELRLVAGGRRLLKVVPASPSAPETVKQTFDRIPSTTAPTQRRSARSRNRGTLMTRSMTRATISIVALAVLTTACVGQAEPGPPAATAPAAGTAAPAGGKLLDGTEKTFVFVGYSTSYRWPNILELMLNRQFEDQIVYHVMNAAEGGAPVGTWIAQPGTRDYQRSYERMLRDWFLPLPSRPDMQGRRRFPNIPAPTIAILQQSLQLSTPLIQGPDDVENIRKGADAMQQLVEQLHRDGVGLVFITTHIYKYTNEPEVEHEKYALAELLARKLPYVWPGPDVWTATKARWPEVFTQPDQVHLNNAGDALDARLWYAHLLRYDRGELEPTLESAWEATWRPSATLRERQTRTQ